MSEIDDAIEQVLLMAERIRRLEHALRPFARFAESREKAWRNAPNDTLFYGRKYPRHELYVGDFRLARSQFDVSKIGPREVAPGDMPRGRASVAGDTAADAQQSGASSMVGDSGRGARRDEGESR